MRALIRAAIVGSVVIGSAAFAQGYVCAIDNLPMYRTAYTQVVDGIMLQRWDCPKGHSTWARP